MDITFILLLSISILFWLAGFFFLFRIPVCRLDSVKVKYPGVSLIIPARNEEYNIGNLLDSLQKQQFKAKQIIVVNDGSTDRTDEISRERGATVIESESLPESWLGKPWACFQGARKATGDVFIFLDADTTLEENGLQKIMDTYMKEISDHNADGRVVLSIAPYHKIKKLYEEFSAMFNIVMLGSMHAFTPIKRIKTTGLFGPCLIVHRDDYYAVNGHEAVKNRILENVFMAAKFRENSIPLKCLGGRGTLSYRMYPKGLKELINGWTKAFASGSSQTPLSALLLIIFWISGGFIISISLLFYTIVNGGFFLWVLLYFAFSLQMYWMLRRIGSFKIISALFFPFHLIFYSVVFSRSLFYQLGGKNIQWKSREVKT
jgi:4,4'-diaponeurosporenoate glycosyltransferase